MVCALLLALKLIDRSVVNSVATAPPLPRPAVNRVAALWSKVIVHAVGAPLGLAHPRYTLVEFADFQCPQCGLVEPEIYRFVTANRSEVNMYFVERPIPQLHKYALGAAEASEIAASQGKFWPMYRVLYANRDDLEPGFLPTYAGLAGVSHDYFARVWSAHVFQPTVAESMDFCDGIGIRATPTLILKDNAYQNIHSSTNHKGNKGEYIVCVGKPEIEKLLKSPPWVGLAATVPDAAAAGTAKP